MARPDGFAVLDGIALCKIQSYQMPDGLIADEGRTAAGTMRRDVLAMTRSWSITLGHLNGDEFARIYNHYRQHMGRSLFWDGHMRGEYPTQAVPVLVRMSSRHNPGPARDRERSGGEPLGVPYWVTESGDFIVTEGGDRIIWDTIQPLAGRDYMGGEITLTIHEVHASAPGGGFQNTPGTEIQMIPGPEGAQGIQGEVGPVGPPGTSVHVGDGPPAALPPARDVYIDAETGDLYELEDS